MTRFIGVASAKGGVGKTTLATNLAWLLNQANEEVLIADFNMNSPDVSHHLSAKNYSRSIVDVLKGHIPLSGAIYKHSSGLKLLPSSQNSHSNELYPKINSLIPDLVEHADFVIGDFPAKLDASTLNILSSFDSVIIVSTPDTLSLKRALDMAKNLKHSDAKVVINKAHNTKSKSNQGIFGPIPHDEDIFPALEARKPVVEFSPHAKSSHEIRKLCEPLTGVKAPNASFTKITSLVH